MNATSWGDVRNASLMLRHIFDYSALSHEDLGIQPKNDANVSSKYFEFVDNNREFSSDLLTLIANITINLISTVGILLNFYVLIVIVLTKQSSSASSILVTHLGVVGIAASSVALGGMPSTGLSCVTRGLLLTLLHPLQLWTVCGLHADKCAAIAAPLHYAAIVSPKKAIASIGMGWSVAIILMSPLTLSYPSIGYSSSLSSCVPACGEGKHAIVYCVIFTAITFFIPTFLVFLCSMKILRIARHHRHRIAAAIYEVTISAQVTVTHQRNPFSPPSSPPRRRSASYAIVQTLGSIVFLYFPFYLTLIWNAIAAPPTLVGFAATILISMAPVVNCVIYGVRSNALKKALKNYWRKKMSKSEVNQEIQARTPSACGSRRPSLSGGSTGSRVLPLRRLSDAGFPKCIESSARTYSCNTLRSPTDGVEQIKVRNSAIPVLRVDPHIVLGRALGLEGKHDKKKKSPRITVTRALSDERNIPERGALCRQQSRSSGALMAASDESAKECEEEQMLLSWPPSHGMQSNY